MSFKHGYLKAFTEQLYCPNIQQKSLWETDGCPQELRGWPKPPKHKNFQYYLQYCIAG